MFSDLTNTEIIFLIIGFLGQGVLHLDLLFNGFTQKKKEKVVFLLYFGI